MPAAKKTATRKRAARKRVAPARDMSKGLAEAAWAEADRALAEALAEFSAWQAGEAGAAEFVGQALRRAARKRGLTLLSEPGAIEPFDGARHTLAKSSTRAPKQVKIKSSGVSRGSEVLAKARAQAVRRKP